MTARGAAEAVLLWTGVGAELLCCAGVLVMRDVFDRLHYVSAASTVGVVLIVSAVMVEHLFDATGVKALLVLVFLGITGPVITHAIARAARLQDFGGPGARDGEIGRTR
jgi:monovalent cation/proton antiporter MnhG/PhaG subunit